MKKVLSSFTMLLMIVAACKKDNTTDLAKTLLVGTWNQVDLKTKTPTGKNLKLSDGGGMESTVFPNYNAYELKNNQLVFKGGNGTLTNLFSISADSLYIEPNIVCQDVNGCATLYARQK
jgi:hypothetical protein